jgi:hypothetical protein
MCMAQMALTVEHRARVATLINTPPFQQLFEDTVTAVIEWIQACELTPSHTSFETAKDARATNVRWSVAFGGTTGKQPRLTISVEYYKTDDPYVQRVSLTITSEPKIAELTALTFWRNERGYTRIIDEGKSANLGLCWTTYLV